MFFLPRRVYRKPSRSTYWVGGWTWAKPRKPRKRTIRTFRRYTFRRRRRLF